MQNEQRSFKRIEWHPTRELEIVAVTNQNEIYAFDLQKFGNERSINFLKTHPAVTILKV